MARIKTLGVATIMVAVMAAIAVGAAVGLATWLIWWPHNDSRAGLAQLYVVLSGGMGALLTARLLAYLDRPGRDLVVPWLALAVLAGLAVHALAVWTTLDACGSCPPWS